jgi:DNA-binding response OmpR family regulator
MTRCPVCDRELPFEQLLPHLLICGKIGPGSRFFVGVVISATSATNKLPESHQMRWPFVFDRERFELRIDETTHRLTAIEARLLAYFMSNPRVVLSRRQILDAVWGIDAFLSEHEVSCYVYRLRQLFRQAPLGRDLIATVRRAGYRFDPEPDDV